MAHNNGEARARLQRLMTLTRMSAVSSDESSEDEFGRTRDGETSGDDERLPRKRGGFKRRPRFPDKLGHEQWYGEWGSGFWGQYLQRDEVNSSSLLRDEFAQRFRIPHDLFCVFEDEMTTAGVFFRPTKSKSVPPRLLLMACFKRLASGAHWPTIAECAFVSAPVLRAFFVNKFLPYFSSDAYYDSHVYYPKSAHDIQRIERAYRAHGFPGCVGSVDAVHMPWDASPAVQNHLFYNGRKGAATYASVVTVDNDCIILYASRVGFGSSNDKTLIRDNDFHNALKTQDYFLNYEYDVLTADGDSVTAKGAYTICDGGFNTHCTTMATISTPTGREAAWTERLESVRKDVERCFGHLKKRFQILRLPSSVMSFAQIGDTWRTCVVLHNILTRRRLQRDYDARVANVATGELQDNDAAVVQAWRERDVSDAQFYARRLRARRVDAREEDAIVNDVMHVDESAIAVRIARAQLAMRSSYSLARTSVEDLRAYAERQHTLVTHYTAFEKRGAVDHLHATRRRVARDADGRMLYIDEFE